MWSLFWSWCLQASSWYVFCFIDIKNNFLEICLCEQGYEGRNCERKQST